MRSEPKLLAQEAGRQLGHDLFAGIGCVAKPAETVVSVQTMGCLGGMGQLMRPDPVKVQWVLEALDASGMKTLSTGGL